MDKPLDLAYYEKQHPLARNGLCSHHQGDNGPCEVRPLLDEVKRLRAQVREARGIADHAGLVLERAVPDEDARMELWRQHWREQVALHAKKPAPSQ